MAVVVDANLLVVMVSGDARGPMASEQVEAWITTEEEIHGPELLPYELAAYIALAKQLGAVLWTLDGPLARSAQAAGFPVRLLDETNR